MLRLKSTVLAVALIGASASTHANDLRINGFMSVGAGVLSNSDVTVNGFDDDMGYSADNIVGLQISKNVNDSTSATVQLVARGNEDFNTEAAWAYITYSPDDNTDLRIGRLRTPFFYYSDFLEVGYAYNWIRPPEEVYRLDAFSSINGVDVTRRFTLGATDGSVQAYVGRALEAFEVNGTPYELSLKNFAGLVVNLTHGNFGYRASAHTADVYTDLVLGGTRDLDQVYGLATLNGVGEDFAVDGKTSHFYEMAATWDNGDISAIAEVTSFQQKTATFLDDIAALYSVAKRFDNTTIHLTYTSKRDIKESNSTVSAIQSLLEQHSTSWIIGARYDYDAGTAFKFEVQRIDEKINSGAEGETGMLYSAALDLVF